MAVTVFRTPLLNRALAILSEFILMLCGWRVEGGLPDHCKYVLIGAPHTSNWDFVLMLMAVLKVHMDLHWLGKSSLFPGPIGSVMTWLGGIPVDRSKSNNLVAQLVELFKRREELIVLIPPEGTRAKVERWKTGFYYVALGAGVPILLGYIDCSRKALGFGPLFYPTGDYEKDLVAIQEFYHGKTGIRQRNG